MAEKSVSTDSLGMEKKEHYTGKKLRMAYIGCGGIAQTHLTTSKPIGCDAAQAWVRMTVRKSSRKLILRCGVFILAIEKLREFNARRRCLRGVQLRNGTSGPQ